MAKVLRLHTNASTELEGWKQSVQIDSSLIQHISDPSGGRARKVSTSIPSPLARMYLFRTAFEFVVNSPRRDLSDNTIYHRMVSQCLDVIELLYNFQKYQQAEKRLLIRRWNINEKLQQLEAIPQHQLLANTLQLFLNYNNPQSPFNGFSDIYLIYYNYRIIAGTSPFTLVFTLPDLGALDLNSSKGYRLFDEPVPLYQRPDDFQLYLNKLFQAYPVLKGRCQSMYEYLTLAQKQAEPQLQQRLNQLQFEAGYGPDNFLNEYAPLHDDTNSQVSVGSVRLASAPAENINIAAVSDFVLQPSRTPEGDRLPLVLREGHYPGWNYVSGQWQQETEVPIKNTAPPESRILPGLSDKYPYLTTGDFLEDHLLELPYELNTDRFNHGKVQYQNGAERERTFRFNYLLPIRREYFSYFSFRDLDKYLTFIVDPAYIKVQLSVPVKRGHILFEKIYYENPQNPRDENGQEIPKKGKIVSTRLGLGVFPFLKLPDPAYNDFYKVMLVDLEVNGQAAFGEFSMQFYLETQPLREAPEGRGIKKTRRISKQEGAYGSTYYEVFNTHFDYAEIIHPLSERGQEPVRGLLIPKWNEAGPGTKRFTFAIDFGTTNTHIAYTTGTNVAPQPFSIEESDPQVVMLNKPSDEAGLLPIQRYKQASLHRAMEIDTVVSREFVPYLIGGQASGAEVAFPIRTATCEVSDFIARPTDMLGNINIGFGINKELDVPGHTAYKTDLKWSTELDRKGNDRIDVFFSELLRLIKHKVALNDGILEQTRLVWFSPLSLDAFAFNLFEEKWTRNYQQIFRTERKPLHLTESAAPYYYLSSAGEVVPTRDDHLLNIDIGGGSTDILFFINQQPAWGSSFRFAGNALWGDGFNKISTIDNGFLLAYQKLADKPFKPKSISQTSADVINDIFNNVDPAMFNNVFIRARYLRVIFYLHYTAILFHCGQIINHLGLKIPRYITFSGKGSLYLNFLSGGGNTSSLERLTRALLEEVCQTPVPDNFRIIQARKPKEATANGGVFFNPAVHDYDGAKPVKMLGTGQGQNLFDTPLRYHDADTQVQQEVLQNAEAFFELVLGNDKLTRFFDDFAIEADLPWLREKIKSKLSDSLHLGMNRLLEHRNMAEKPLPETLFFYPLYQTLYELSKEIYKAHYDR
ncbi:hypothetical protein [Cesiribacter sp. SM1]|uniref:hypothetical protein n=1 Tax=Cesiribacter sp. SM1 TaxID=2861196 RepID=UPI001CD5606C|nr:hypothetical protein [Cesiribacter sp. SM1]